jgi:hypothetical protein
VARGHSANRHGRGLRNVVTGPYLPPLMTRILLFESTVASMAEYLTDLWPAELADVRFEVAGLPAAGVSRGGVDRWHVDARQRRIILYRVPIERLTHFHVRDEVHLVLVVESCVVRAVAELLGKDPWDLAPDRFRHL